MQLRWPLARCCAARRPTAEGETELLEPMQAPPNPAAPYRAGIPRVTFSAPNLDWLLVILLQRWRWILASTLLAAISVLLALPFLPRQYEISAALLFKLGREQVAPAVAGTGAAATPFKRTEDVTSEAEIITSQALVENLVNAFGTDYFLAHKAPQTAWEQLKYLARSFVSTVRDAITELMILIGLEKRLTPFEGVVSALLASLHAETVKRSDVINVTLLLADQKAGIEVMNKLIELYLAEHIRAFQTPGATKFLADRVNAMKAELSGLESERSEFSRRFSLWDFDEQRKSLLLQQRELRQALARSGEDIGRVSAELRFAETSLANPSPERRVSRVAQANPVAQALQMRVVDQRGKLERLRLVYGADSRRIEDEETELSQLQKHLDDQARSMTQSETFEVSEGQREAERTLADRRGRSAGLKAQEQRQREQGLLLVAELLRLDTLGERSRRLNQDISLAEQNYQLYVRRLEEARISDALGVAEISNVSMIGRPTASISPIRPRAKLLFLGALAGGLLGSFGFLMLREALRPTVHSRDKAAAILGAPALGRLPEVRR